MTVLIITMTAIQIKKIRHASNEIYLNREVENIPSLDGEVQTQIKTYPSPTTSIKWERVAQ